MRKTWREVSGTGTLRIKAPKTYLNLLSHCLFNLYAEYIMRNTGLRKHKLESRLPGEMSITSEYADDTTLMAESKELKTLLSESERRVEKLS